MTSLLRSLMVAAMVAGAALGATPALAQDGSVSALYRESYRLEAASDAKGALGKMREIRAKAGASYFVAMRSGWLAYLVGEFAAAEMAYAEAAGFAPKAVEARLGLTLPLLAQKKWRELERACREVLALDPHSGVGRTRLGAALYAIGNYPDAALVYRKLVEDYPAELDHQTGLGWAMLRMGRRAEAKQVFAAVLAVSPDNVNAQQGMAAQ